jgi:hypothetical protein
MPSPSVDMMWQEIRMLKARVCALEATTNGLSAGAGMLQFMVGEPKTSAYYTKDINNVTLPTNNTYILTIKDTNVRYDSLDVYWDSGIMAKGRLDRESYTVSYAPDKVIITRTTGYPFLNGQFYIVKYAYVS